MSRINWRIAGGAGYPARDQQTTSCGGRAKKASISSVDRLIDWSAATGCSPMLGARWRSSRLQHQLLRLEHPSRPERPDKRPPGQSRKGPTLDKSIARFAATRQPDEVSDRDEHVWRAEIVRFCLPITPEPASPVSN